MNKYIFFIGNGSKDLAEEIAIPTIEEVSDVIAVVNEANPQVTIFILVLFFRKKTLSLSNLFFDLHTY